MSEQGTKARRRLAEQLAAQKAAEAKRRRQAWAGGFAGIAVVAVLITVFVIVGQRGGDDAPEQVAGSPSAPADAPAEPGAPGAPPAPQLPEGADPALGTKPNVTGGEGELTKLTVTPLIEGTGPAVTTGQSITTNYVGVLFANGEQFDSSWDRGQPATFPIGVGQVIEGWDKGLVGVKVGSRVQLDIPAEQAYGTDGAGGRPAGPLRFVVDILAAQ
ncbi:FKBP-type peptidyl-prolyl cis-trans isomerase [Micromonospora craniellae]|uniref:Peptidyl-prolyl cis-trans isomerase n=1 Tax=Micromonospora craniellae TaxID=2294034 RepID=A0A372FTY5_9ACTN|nr:FKBP-type peptidyl-prolyl cis-trans isomerase [Micromonospora craniellae]QOC94025.1 FKBP-type peptidyl-prolyl cis-trans isomerase [Micromonospora craniellae]RFS44084.1 peptidylprolyl isomerase [Micromonospora craniellae]